MTGSLRQLSKNWLVNTAFTAPMFVGHGLDVGEIHCGDREVVRAPRYRFRDPDRWGIEALVPSWLGLAQTNGSLPKSRRVGRLPRWFRSVRNGKTSMGSATLLPLACNIVPAMKATDHDERDTKTANREPDL
jgi:hypothetical protein